MKQFVYCKYCGKCSYIEPTTVMYCVHCGRDITFQTSTSDQTSTSEGR